MLSIGKAYSDDLRWRIVYMSQMLGMKTVDISSLIFVSERTILEIRGTLQGNRRCGSVR